VGALRGYERGQVDHFKLQVAEELERLTRDRMQAEERLRSAQEQLKVFRERERAMNEALVAAQQLREDSRQQAEREAELIRKEAQAEAHRIVAQARQDEVEVRVRADSASRQFTAYVAGFRSLLQRQLAELDVLEGHARAIIEEQAEDLARSRE
jgi:cell division septum initiation protein DivIVA